VIKEIIGKLPFAVKEVLRQKELFEQKQQMEQTLLQSEENFRQSLASSPLGIRIVDIQGQTVYANQAFLDIFDIKTLGEFTSVPSVNRYTPDSYIEHLKRKEIRSSGKEVPEYEVSIKRNNGEIRHVKILRKEVFWNREKHYQVINQDITLQKNAEEQVRKISQAVEQNPDAIIITDINGNIEYINPQTTFLSGIRKKNYWGKTREYLVQG
jgi:PAS domain S-box-containing protein